MKSKQEKITIVGDGNAVIARKYVDGELTCSAEALKPPHGEYDFEAQATNALYALRDKLPAVEYCKADADSTKAYYDYRKAHPELFPEELQDCNEASSKESHEVQSDYDFQNCADDAALLFYIIYGSDPKRFWSSFKQGKFCIKIYRDEWSSFVEASKPYNLVWDSGEIIYGCDGFNPFNHTDKDCIYIGIEQTVTYSVRQITYRDMLCYSWYDALNAISDSSYEDDDAEQDEFWEDFKDHKFILQVYKDDWEKFTATATEYDVKWCDGETLNGYDYFLTTDYIYVGYNDGENGISWNTQFERFNIPELTVIRFSGGDEDD